MDAQKVLSTAERNRLWIIRCKDEYEEKAFYRMLYINFVWLKDLLTEEELDSVDPINVKVYKRATKKIGGEKPYAKLTYRGKEYYLADDDYGQCMSLYVDDKWMGLGTYNFDYMRDAKYIIREKFFVQDTENAE